MQQSESIAELAKALAAAQGEFKPIPRTADNPFFKSKYAPLASVVEATAPILAKHGLAVMQLPERIIEDGSEELVTILMHASGEFIRSSMLLRLKDLSPQGQGSAITYARRYSYSAALGIVSDEDDDANLASRLPVKRQQAPRIPPGGIVPPPAEKAYHERMQELSPPVQTSIDGEIVPEEDMEARRARIIAEAKARGPLVEKAESVQATQRRTRPSPLRQPS